MKPSDTSRDPIQLQSDAFLFVEMSFLLISDSDFVSDHYGVDNAEMATVGSVLSGTIQVWPLSADFFYFFLLESKILL